MPENVLAFLTQPFSPEMSAMRWFLFLGLILVLLWAWHHIFREISAVEQAVT